MEDISKIEYSEHVVHLNPPTMGESGESAFGIFKDAMGITKSKNVLEIGFNRGSSALSFLLSNSECKVISIEIASRESCEKSISYLNNTFDNRLTFIQCNSAELLSVVSKDNNIDLVFIDGDHTLSAIDRDVSNSLQLNPKYILFDDSCHPAHGNDVHTVINKYNLKIVKEYTEDVGRCLCEVPIHGVVNE